MESEDLIGMILEEMRDVYSIFKRLQQRYRLMEEWLLECYRSKRAEENSNSKSRHRATRIYYNSNWKTRGSVQKNCNWCGRTGHIEEDCWQKKGVCTLCGSEKHTLTACSKYEHRTIAQPLLHCNRDIWDNTAAHDVWFRGKAPCSTPQESEEGGSFECSGMDSNSEFDSRLSSSSNVSTPRRKKRIEKQQDNSFCFSSRENVADDVLDESVIFPAELAIRSPGYYQLCALEQTKPEDQVRGTSTGQDNGDSTCVSGYGRIVLKTPNETWDVSSIENPDELEQPRGNRNNSAVVKERDLKQPSKRASNGMECAPVSQPVNGGKGRCQTGNWWWCDGFTEKTDGRDSII